MFRASTSPPLSIWLAAPPRSNKRVSPQRPNQSPSPSTNVPIRPRQAIDGMGLKLLHTVAVRNFPACQKPLAAKTSKGPSWEDRLYGDWRLEWRTSHCKTPVVYLRNHFCESRTSVVGPSAPSPSDQERDCRTNDTSGAPWWYTARYTKCISLDWGKIENLKNSTPNPVGPEASDEDKFDTTSNRRVLDTNDRPGHHLHMRRFHHFMTCYFPTLFMHFKPTY